jgi:hypothetical protein
MSEWQMHNGGNLEGSHWDGRDREWEPERVQYEWRLEDDVWHVNTSRFKVIKIYYDAEDSELPKYVDPVEETSFPSQLPPDIVRQRIWPLVFDGRGLSNI